MHRTISQFRLRAEIEHIFDRSPKKSIYRREKKATPDLSRILKIRDFDENFMFLPSEMPLKLSDRAHTLWTCSTHELNRF